ncbi:MAG TPA: gephyrin-like molybdotransferase Glp [Desulfuromonadales bacterium]|nr:gephyrin-like molybdotransferase Glp [Desulfuromonadales bacterium]
MISYDDALQRVIETVSSLEPVEIPLCEAAGLVLSSPAASRWDLPRNDNSAMDGFAIKASAEDLDKGLRIIGASYAGHPFTGDVQEGQTVRITTGAVLPSGADTVVPIEEVEEKNGLVFPAAKSKSGQHVRYRGEEFYRGDVLIEPGGTIRAGEIALLASAGIERVIVFPRPRVAVISTGDELLELGQEPGPGQIINSNLYFLENRLSECGCTPVCFGIGTDDPGTLDHLIEQALDADVIISTGGVSVGDKDHVQATLNERDFTKVFWKVAIKPGKPILFGLLEGKPCFGLPGNPGSTAATFELFVKPALKKLAGHPEILPEKREAILKNEVAGNTRRQIFLWSRLEWNGTGYEVTVPQRQGSGQNRCLTAANALLSVAAGIEKIDAGEKVEVFLL